MANALSLGKAHPLGDVRDQLLSLAAVAETLASIAVHGAEQPGIIKDFGGPEANIPSGYLLCDGREVSRTTYADLYAAIGTTWGTGDGSTTFNLPDLRGRTTAGDDAMGGTAANRLSLGPVGDSGGVQEVTLTSAQSGSPAHAHTASSSLSEATTNSTGAHTHTWTYDAPEDPPGSLMSIAGDATSASQTVTTSSAGAHSHTVSGTVTTTVNNSTATDAAQAHTNVQPTAIVNKIIKT